MTNKKKIVSWKFTTTALVALLFAWANTALTMGGLAYLSNVIKTPYYSGAMLGTAVKWLAFSFVVAIIINFIANRFRKEKKHFSYFMVWFFLLISIVGTMANIMQQIGVEEPAARFNFIQGCVANAKATKEFRSLKADDKQHEIYNISQYCDGLTTGYFKFFDQCMKTTQDNLACNKQALFKQCMVMKNDQNFCQTFTTSVSIK